MQVKKQQLEVDMEQQTGSKSGKESIKAVYCHPAYLTYSEFNWTKHVEILFGVYWLGWVIYIIIITFTYFFWCSFPCYCSVQFSRSVISDSATPWIAAHQASLSITNSRSLLKLMSVNSVMPSSHLILCHPLLLLPSIFPSIRVCSNESTLHTRWSKYCSLSFSISPSNEHPGLISFSMDWWDLLAVHGTLKSLLQHHSSKASPQFKSINSSVVYK